MNTEASNRANSEFNTTYIPSCYTDGGYVTKIGVDGAQAGFESMLAAAGARPVSDVGVVIHTTWLGGGSLQIDYAIAHGTPTNTVSTPPAPTGPVELLIDVSGAYTALNTDAEGDSLWYMWDWGDGNHSGWLGPYASGDPCVESYAYSALGDYDISVSSKDYFHEAGYSPLASVHILCCVDRGNVDNIVGPAGPIDVSDLTYLVAFLFTGGPPPPCEEAGNVDGLIGPAGPIDVSDLTYLVAFLFTGGPPPPPC